MEQTFRIPSLGNEVVKIAKQALRELPLKKRKKIRAHRPKMTRLVRKVQRRSVEMPLRVELLKNMVENKVMVEPGGNVLQEIRFAAEVNGDRPADPGLTEFCESVRNGTFDDFLSTFYANMGDGDL